MEKLIITVAPTGSVPRKMDTPYVSITPDEIAETAYLCEQTGASIIHVHCRDQNENPTSDYHVFRKLWRRFGNAHISSSWSQQVEWQPNLTKNGPNHSTRTQKWPASQQVRSTLQDANHPLSTSTRERQSHSSLERCRERTRCEENGNSQTTCQVCGANP